MAGLYLAAGVLLAWPRLRPPRRWCGAALLAWLAVGQATSPAGLRAGRVRTEHNLHCTFVAVNHGAGVVVEFPGGQTLLYDAGTLGSPQPAVQSISAVLWSRGVRRLDAVVLSHADADHYNALPGLLKRFPVGVVYASPAMLVDMAKPLPLLREAAEPLPVLREAIAKAGVPLRPLCFLDRLRTAPPTSVAVLHPPPAGVPGGDNANTLVLLVEYARRRILLTGDLASPGLEDVLAEEPLPCDVLMAPHHGSATSPPRPLADWSTPRWLVISGGAGEHSGLVEQLYAARGTHVLHTARHGAVQFAIAPDGAVTAQTWRPAAKPP